MPTRDEATCFDVLERDLAEVMARISHLNQESKLFGRLGFCAEQMRLEMRQLEKRRDRIEQAIKHRTPETNTKQVVQARKVEA